MDLDKVKDAWKKSSSQPTINREKIEHIINKDGVSAFMKMKRYSLRGGIVCLAYGLFLFILITFFIDTGNRNIPLFYVCSIILLIGSIWSIYCYHYLNKMDLGKMDLASFSSQFHRFRKWEKWEWLAKGVFIILIISSLIYVQYDHIIQANNAYKVGFIVGNTLSILISGGIGLFIYRKFYSKNLRKVEDALKEIEDLNNE